MRVRIAGCVFDPDARTLEREGRSVALSPKAFQLLTLLLERRPSALSHHELRDALWPDVAVGYTSLAQVVAEVRRALADDTRAPRFVRTVPRFGYAFMGDVRAEEPFTPRPVVGTFVAGRAEHAIAAGETLIGRGPECDLVLPAAGVSRVHARVVAGERGISVVDAGSKNGTWVNGAPCPAWTAVKDGDEVTFGTYRTIVRTVSRNATTRTVISTPNPARQTPASPSE